MASRCRRGRRGRISACASRTGDDRSYSLINLDTDPLATTRPHAYRLGVRLEDPSQGGSRFMHALKPGDQVATLPPANNFPLNPGPQPVVLIAGGIGITPIVSMAAVLAAEGRPYRLYYAGRSRDQLAFIDDIEALCGDRLVLHTDDTASTVFDVRGLMASLKRRRAGLLLRSAGDDRRRHRRRQGAGLAGRPAAVRTVHGGRAAGRRSAFRGRIEKLR